MQLSMIINKGGLIMTEYYPEDYFDEDVPDDITECE